MHVIGTAGHVDHGKSTLTERLTGIDPDRWAEEKRRGLTIDLGFAWVRLASGREVGIVDVPGHERFVRNMLAGAGGFSMCLFVVAANEGWKPQSAEHLGIIDVLQVRHGVVAVTKSDTVDSTTLDEVTADVRRRVAETSLATAPIVACSAMTGTGMDDLTSAIDRELDAMPTPEDRGRPRLWIDRVFTIAGAGTVVTGSLWHGALEVGQEVVVEPSLVAARVRDIQTHKRRVQSIAPGNRVALNLAGVDKHKLERGNAVVVRGQWASTKRVDAFVRVLPEEIVARDHRLAAKGAYLLYVGSAETPVQVRLWDVRKLAPGESGYARLTLRDPLPLAFGDRFVIRDAGRVLTIGGGVVLDPSPAGHGRGDERVAQLQRLLDASPERALAELVGGAGLLTMQDALARSGASRVPDDVVRVGRRVASHAWVDAHTKEMDDVLRAYHGAHPSEQGMAKEQLRRHVDLDPEVFDALLAASDALVVTGATVRLRTHAASLSPDQQRQAEKLLMRLREAGLTPPATAELGVDAGLLRALVEQGEVVRIDDFYLAVDTANSARNAVRAHIEEHGPATVAQIRDLLGTTRKYAVPLCEWLDATGATRRRGDVRVLGPNP